MIDAEIIKALECCSKPRKCGECPYLQECSNGKTFGLEADALDLINRQKAEIERLQAKCENTQIGYNFLKADYKDLKAENLETISCIKTAKAEAIKEFAERLKAECRQDRYAIQTSTKFGVVDKQYLRVVDESDIDNLVKEMVGDTE